MERISKENYYLDIAETVIGRATCLRRCYGAITVSYTHLDVYKRQEYTLKPGMLLGAATAATQIEGGDQNNNWYDWYRRGYIKDNSDPSVATEHYVRWREDLDLMADMGLQCYRFGPVSYTHLNR